MGLEWISGASSTYAAEKYEKETTKGGDIQGKRPYNPVHENAWRNSGIFLLPSLNRHKCHEQYPKGDEEAYDAVVGPDVSLTTPLQI